MAGRELGQKVKTKGRDCEEGESGCREGNGGIKERKDRKNGKNAKGEFKIFFSHPKSIPVPFRPHGNNVKRKEKRLASRFLTYG